MRFKLILEINKRAFGNKLPINYQYEQSAAIYKILSGADEAYASWLHDNGFRLESGKTFKLFVYSRFKIENFRILRDTERLQIFSDTVEWQVGFLLAGRFLARKKHREIYSRRFSRSSIRDRG